MSGGSGSTGDEERERKRAAVERELERETEAEDRSGDDLVDTVQDEQRREREATADEAE